LCHLDEFHFNKDMMMREAQLWKMFDYLLEYTCHEYLNNVIQYSPLKL